jgi:ParB family transcriptional regulator, chromosome partitioning protein
MTEKRKVLGRGLESLLPPRPFSHVPSTLSPKPGEPGGAPAGEQGDAPGAGDHDADAAAAVTTAVATALLPGESVQELALAQLDPNPYQTRATMDEAALAELRESIAAMGVIEPIIVRPNTEAEGRYQVIAGARRVQASTLCGKEKIPAIVRQVSNQQAMVMTLVENLQREDLNQIDQARSYQRLSQEFGLTQDEVAKYTGKERSSIANYMRLLRLPEEVQKLLAKDILTMGHAKVLLTISESAPEIIVRAAVKAIGLTVRQTEALVADLTQVQPKAKKERIVDPNVREAEQTLQRALGVRVMINDRKGKGKIVLQYKSLEDFDRIVEAVTRP